VPGKGAKMLLVDLVCVFCFACSESSDLSQQVGVESPIALFCKHVHVFKTLSVAKLDKPPQKVVTRSTKLN